MGTKTKSLDCLIELVESDIDDVLQGRVGCVLKQPDPHEGENQHVPQATSWTVLASCVVECCEAFPVSSTHRGISSSRTSRAT